MTRIGDFSLVPLDCSTCGAAMAADGLDVVFYCSACRNGYRLDTTSSGLTPLEVEFVTRPDLRVDEYKPFWSIPAEVEIEGRTAKSGGFTGILGRIFGEGPPSDRVASTVFAVPAFKLEISRAVELTRRYTADLPRERTRLGERLIGGCFDVDDAHKIVHYSVIATEVDRPDLLTRLQYRIDFGEPRLLGIPFVAESGTLHDARHHIVV